MTNTLVAHPYASLRIRSRLINTPPRWNLTSQIRSIHFRSNGTSFLRRRNLLANHVHNLTSCPWLVTNILIISFMTIQNFNCLNCHTWRIYNYTIRRLFKSAAVRPTRSIARIELNSLLVFTSECHLQSSDNTRHLHSLYKDFAITRTSDDLSRICFMIVLQSEFYVLLYCVHM